MMLNLKDYGIRLSKIICHRRTRKIALWSVGVFAAYALILSAAPPLLRHKIAGVLSETLHREVSIEEMWVNPFTMAATVRRFVVKEPRSASTVVSFDELYVNLQLQSLFRWGPVIREARLVKPYVSLVRQQDRKYNIQDLIDQFTAGPEDPTAPTPRFALYNVEILDGEIVFDDRPEQTKHRISSLRMGVPFISSLPAHIDITVKPAFSAVIDGAPLEIGGDTYPFQDSRRTKLLLNVENIEIPKYLRYSPVKLNFKVPSGTINGRLTASFTNFTDKPPTLVVAGNLAVKELTVNETGGVPLFKLPSLELDIGGLDVFANKLTLTTARVQGLELHLHQDRAGEMNLANLISLPAEESPANAQKEAAPFTYRVDDFVLEQGKVFIIDEMPANPYSKTLINVRIAAKSVTNEKNKKGDVKLSFETETKEQLNYRAEVQLDPLLVDGHFDLKKFRLPPLRPYYEQALNMDIRDGILDLSGAHHVAQEETDLVLRVSDLNAAVGDLAVHESGQAEPLWSIPKIQIKNTSVDLNRRRVAVGAFESQGGKGSLQLESDGTTNYSRLVKATVAEEPGQNASAETAWIITVDNAALDRYELVFDDKRLANPFRKTLTNLRLTAKSVTTEKDQKGDVAVSFETESKEQFDYSASVQLEPLLVQGQFALKEFRIGPLLPYYQNLLNVAVREGLLDLSGEHTLAAGGDELAVSLGNLNASFKSLEVYLAGKPDPLWSIPSLLIKDTNVDINDKSISIGALESFGARGSVEREADGTINYARLLKPQPASEQTQTVASETPWQLTAQRIHLDGFGVVFEDNAMTPPTQVVLADLTLHNENFSNAKDTLSEITVQARVNDKGQLRVAGSLGAFPPTGELTLDAMDVDLLPFQPYMTDRVNFLMTSGKAGTNGKLTFNAGGEGPLKLGYQGKIQITDLVTAIKSESQDLLKWKSLDLNDVQFALEPMQVTINDIILNEFYSRLILGADGQFNLQQLLANADDSAEVPDAKPAVPEEPAPNGETKTGGETPITIGQIRFHDGNINFTDRFIKPNYSANLTGVTGSISELKDDVPADMQIQAKLDKGAPVKIGGKINPLAKDLFLDLEANARGIELSPISAYSAKYVGYGIENGTLTFNVKYKIDARKLTADNQFILNQLNFGEKVESPDATTLPVLLAVALMKDRNGVIDVDLPISGSIDDPQFSVGGVVLKVITNIIGKAITAPFALLGALVGAGADADLSHVEFDYGRATLTQAGEITLKSLAKAMNSRPALKLEIAGRVDPVNDLAGLKNVGMETKVRAQKVKHLMGQGKAPESLDDLRIEKDEYERYLNAAYGEASFPKPRSVIGIVKDLPVPEMEKLMLQHMEISEDAMRELAIQRAQIVKDYLLASGQVSADRLFVVPASSSSQPEGSKAAAKLSRVDFSLK